VEHCVYKSAAKNNVVILGRGGNWLLKDVPYALRVRIIGAPEDRAASSASASTGHGNGPEKLKFRVNERTLSTRGRIAGLDQPNDYDITLNTSHMGFDEAVERIVSEIRPRTAWRPRKTRKCCAG
jgi:cytidylate kinase